MSCAECEDTREKDDVEPPCETPPGDGEPVPGVSACWIPPLDEDAQAAKALRDDLILLGPLIGPEAVLRMRGATRGDLELVRTIEEELREMAEEDAEEEEGRT